MKLPKPALIAVIFLLAASAATTVQASLNITSVTVSPSAPFATTQLTCTANYVNFNPGNLSANVTFDWHKNGALQAGLSGVHQNAAPNSTASHPVSVPATLLRHFDNWSCAATPSNETFTGLTARSSNTTIGNSLPVLAVPNQTVVQSSPMGSLNLSLYATDADNDNLTFVLVSENVNLVDCTVLGSNLTFVPVPGASGTATCALRASDGFGTSGDYPFTVTVTSYSLSLSPSSFSGNQNDTLTATLTLTNNGQNPLNSITLGSTAGAAYNVTLSPGFFTSLVPGQSASVQMSMKIPSNEPTGAKTIGNFDIRSDRLNTTQPISLTVSGRLSFDAILAYADGERDTSADKTGGRIDRDVRPGSEIKLKIRLKNDFSRSSDVDLQDVVITVTVFDIDDGDDLELESKDLTIRAGSDNTQTLTFKVPYKAEERTYNMEIEAQGEDDFGTDHTARVSIALEVERRDHDVRILEAAFDSDTAKCTRSNGLNLLITNLGTEEEDEATVDVKSTDLGVSRREVFHLSDNPDDADNDYKLTLPFTVAADKAAGSYPVRIQTFYKGTVPQDFKEIRLAVEDCTAAQPTSPSSQQPPAPARPSEDVVVTPTQPPVLVATPAEQPFTESTAYLLLLGGAAVVLTGGLLALLFRLAGRQ